MGGAASKREATEVACPEIRLINFDDFKSLAEFPRYPEKKDICVSLGSIDRDNSYIIFISHCWLRGWSGADGWDGRPHPDNKLHEKMQLCIAGIARLYQIMAPRMTHCYVWVDFGCMDQDGNPAGELKQLDSIVQNSDALFTPIAEYPDVPIDVYNWYDDYNAAAWNGDEHGYINRGWCRVEMFYAANIQTMNLPERLTKFENVQNKFAADGIRPHFLFSNREMSTGKPPMTLSPLQNSLFEKFHPEKGKVTMPQDMVKIQELVALLRPHMTFVEGGYVGELLNGQRHGQGEYTWEDGSVYVGGWKHDKRDGKGVFTYADGDMYDGYWENGVMQGQGVFTYATGVKYCGAFKNDAMDGFGTYTFLNGNVYEGEWKNDNQHGHGKLSFANGDVYTGAFENDTRKGQGTLVTENGSVTYRGSFMDGKRHGYGSLTHTDGDVYDGEWCNDQQEGQGTFTWACGDKYVGQFMCGNMHGHGVFTHASGDVYEGEWHADNRHGEGVLTYASGHSYKGSWHEDKQHGSGIFTHKDGHVYEGNFKYHQRHGRGVYTHADGSVIHDGEWIEGEEVL